MAHLREEAVAMEDSLEEAFKTWEEQAQKQTTDKKRTDIEKEVSCYFYWIWAQITVCFIIYVARDWMGPIDEETAVPLSPSLFPFSSLSLFFSVRCFVCYIPFVVFG